jgi:hypothetical protein
MEKWTSSRDPFPARPMSIKMYTPRSVLNLILNLNLTGGVILREKEQKFLEKSK